MFVILLFLADMISEHFLLFITRYFVMLFSFFLVCSVIFFSFSEFLFFLWIIFFSRWFQHDNFLNCVIFLLGVQLQCHLVWSLPQITNVIDRVRSFGSKRRSLFATTQHVYCTFSSKLHQAVIKVEKEKATNFNKQ